MRIPYSVGLLPHKTLFLVLFICSVDVSPAWAQQPDLVITTPISCPSNVYAGSTYQFSATIRNQGNKAAQFAGVSYYLSRNSVWDATDVYLGGNSMSMLWPPNSGSPSITAVVPHTMAAGNYYMVFVADPLNIEQESNELNNELAVALTVTVNGTVQLPDVLPWRPSIGFTTMPASGQFGAFTFAHNLGPGSASNIEMGYYLSADTLFSTADVILGTSEVGSLPPSGMTVTSNPVMTIPPSTAPGRYYVLYVADHLNRILETNEVNNSKALAVTITGAVTASATASAGARVRAYPNPIAAGEWLSLETEDRRPLRVSLQDALGRVVVQQTLHAEAGATGKRLNLAGIAPGLYTLQLNPGQAVIRQRLLIQ